MQDKKKRKPRVKRMYFTKEHENAIIEYNNSTDFKRKTELYETLIHPALDEMVDKIVYTYKFTVLPNIAELQSDCKVMLVMILHKFKPEKGHKAFSYFSVITKNWFIAQVKKNKKKNSRETSLDCQLENGYEPGIEDPYHDLTERQEFMALLKEEIAGQSEHNHKEVSLAAAKYLETLQRSNEQLVKIAGLVQKDEKSNTSFSFSGNDKDDIYNMIQKEDKEG